MEPKDPADTSQPAVDPHQEDLVEPENALPEVKLEELPEQLRKACALQNWTELMPVQAKAIPYIMARRDLMVQSRTGSGKTGAFILPLLKRLDPAKAACQVLVLVPTRELAVQVQKEAEIMGKAAGLRSVAVYGGVGYGPQLEAFRKGFQIVVGTPGRVLDHLLKGTLSLRQLQVLVFDEADRLLSMGFYPDMKRVKIYLPKRAINGYMFSATFPSHVARLARMFLRNPDFLSLSSDRVFVAEVEHIYYYVPGMEKDRCLARIIEIENPTSMILFCNTKDTVHYLSAVLQRFGYDADELTADLSQVAREKVLKRLRKGELRFLVATDLAARGIDISELSHVIQYEPPKEVELYIHRSGRTGRVGHSGVVISLVAGVEQLELHKIGKRYGLNLQERDLPTDEDVAAIVSQRVTALLEAVLRERDSLQIERMQRFLPLARNLAEDEDLSALVAMLLDDYYQQTLHAPPPQPPGESKPQRRTAQPLKRTKRPGHAKRPGRRR